MASQFANEREAVFAEEAFVVDVQILLHKIMEKKGFSRADLARAMNVSRPRITQIFSDECKNLTVRLLARAMHAMGESPELICAHDLDESLGEMEFKSREGTVAADDTLPNWVQLETVDSSDDWRPANDNWFVSLRHIRQSRADFRMAAQ